MTMGWGEVWIISVTTNNVYIYIYRANLQNPAEQFASVIKNNDNDNINNNHK